MESFGTIHYLVLALGWGAACFYVYLTYLRSPGIQGRFIKRFGEDPGKLWHAVTAKLIGFLLMGVGTLWFAVLMFGFLVELLIGLRWDSVGWPEHLLLLILAIAMFFISYNRRNSEELFAAYPETRLSSWNSRRMWIYLTAWFSYLLGYELMFRGLLLVSLVPIVGPFWALGIHVVIYTMAHIHKDRKELWGSALFGLVIGGFCVYSLSIVPALILHLIISLSTQYFAIRNSEAFH